MNTREEVAQVAAAQSRAEADQQHWQEYYQAGHVPATSTGEHENRPRRLPDDPVITGVQPAGAR